MRVGVERLWVRPNWGCTLRSSHGRFLPGAWQDPLHFEITVLMGSWWWYHSGTSPEAQLKDNDHLDKQGRWTKGWLGHVFGMKGTE